MRRTKPKPMNGRPSMTSKRHPSESYWIGVTGDFSSGKTAFIRSISEYDVTSTDYEIAPESYIAFDYGRIAIDSHLCLDLHGNPGGYSAHGVLRIPRPNLLGVVVLVNSRRPRSFPITRSVISTLSAFRPVPFVVAMNPRPGDYYDPAVVSFMGTMMDGLTPDDLRIVLRVPDEIPIIPCIAIDKTSVKAVLLTLLEKVIEALDAPDETEDPV